MMGAGQLQQHPRRWFAAETALRQGWIRKIRMMRAKKNIGEMDTRRRRLCHQMMMKCLHLSDGEIATRNATLVGDNK